MTEYMIKTPMWTADKTLYRPGKRNVSDAHARELGLTASASTGPGSTSGGEASKGAAVKYPYPEVLAAGGFRDWESVKNASDAELLAVDGIGPSRLEEIRAYKG